MWPMLTTASFYHLFICPHNSVSSSAIHSNSMGSSVAQHRYSNMSSALLNSRPYTSSKSLSRKGLASKNQVKVNRTICNFSSWNFHSSANAHNNLKLSLRRRASVSVSVSASASASASSSVELKNGKKGELMKELISFLEHDLPHLFDEQGIDKRMYDEKVEFRDPITKYDGLDGYLFNIGLLRLLFRPLFQLHSVKQTGPYEITTRWTMVMTFGLLPWKPELIFTGTSVMDVNPETGKFCSHVDYWDSIKQNDYFSFEGLMDVLKQLQIYKTPDLETPKYQILKRKANYEVRKYESFIVIETEGDKLTGSSGFNNVAGYIFGKNSKEEKIPMTTPVFTQTLDGLSSQVRIQIVLPSEKQISEFPEPLLEGLQLRKIQDNIAAATKFSGAVTDEIVFEKERDLRAALIRDGIQPKPGCMLARYNDPNRTWSFIRRNEILIWLDTFFLE